MAVEYINENDTLNVGRVKINAAIDQSNDAIVKATNAEISANQAVTVANDAKTQAQSTQAQLDNIIIENGQSDAEVVQARTKADGTTFPLLKDRLNDVDNKLLNIMNSTGINVDSFPRLDGETDDSGRIQRAIDSLPDGGVLIFPYGKTYFASNVNCNGKSITIIGIGSKIIQNSNATVFNFYGGWDFIVGITSISVVDYDFSQGNNITTKVAKLTLSSIPPTPLKAGDIVKIVSDDEIENTLQGTGTAKKRKGEFATVALIEGNDVYLTGKLRETYSSNIRLAKLKDVSFSIKGLTFDIDQSGDSEGWNRVIVKVTAAQNVDLDIKCLAGYDSFVLLTGIYGYKARIDARNLRNEPSNNRYGYGINDAACENGVVYDSYFINCRHGYTTTTGYVDAGSGAIESYGRSANTIVVNSYGFGCSNSAFDVHEDAYNITFINCHSRGNIAGAVGSGAGFQARAKKIKFINCSATDTKDGFYIFEQYAGTTDDVMLINCSTSNVETSLNVAGNSGEGIRVRNVSISGGKFESYGLVGNSVINADISILNSAEFITVGYQGFVIGDNVSATIKDAKFIVVSDRSAFRIIDITGQNSILEMRDIDVDISETVATDGKLFRLSNNTANLSVRRMNVRTNGKKLSKIFDSLGVGTGSLIAIDIRVDQDVLILEDENFNTLSYSFVTPTKSSAVNFQDLNTDNLQLDIKGIYDDVFVRVKAVGGNRILGVIPKGVRLGQRLTIRNSVSSYTTTIKNGSNWNTAIGADKVLPVDGAFTMMWDGSNWVNIF